MTVSLLVLTPECFSCSKLQVWINCIGAIETISERQALILTTDRREDCPVLAGRGGRLCCCPVHGHAGPELRGIRNVLCRGEPTARRNRQVESSQRGTFS